jgi:hypothetical protein
MTHEAGADQVLRITSHQKGRTMSGITPTRRVRHEVRDGLLVMGFSLATSCLVTLVVMALTTGWL